MDYEIVYTEKQANDGKITLTAHAVKKGTKSRVSSFHSRTCTNDTIKRAGQELENTIRKEFKELTDFGTSPSTITEYDVDKTFAIVLADPTRFLNRDWNSNTRNDSFTYFENNVLDVIKQHGMNLTQEIVDSHKEELVNTAMHSKRSKNDRSIAESSVGKMLFRAQIIYQWMRQVLPALPNVDFSMGKTRKAVRKEQFKSLPDSSRVALVALLAALIETPLGGLALGLLLMFFGGLRPAEAAGMRFQNIAEYETYATVRISFQMKDGTFTDSLKTDNAYRIVVLPYIALHYIRVRIAYLKHKGMSAKEIGLLPCVCTKDSLDIMAGGDDLSALGREVITLCVDANYFDSFDPEVYDGDVSAYILRRDYATRISNICGMPPDVIDYLLGHKNDAAAHKDYISADAQADIARMLERYVADPDLSLNPIFRPFPLSPTGPMNLPVYTGYNLIADCPPDTKLRVRALINLREPREESRITLPSEAISARIAVLPDRAVDRVNRIVIGHPADIQYYERHKRFGRQLASKFKSERRMR